MGTQKMDVFFRGDIAPGQSLIEVRERLQKLFNADDNQMQRLFSGRPVAIRRNLDSQAAEQYREAVLKAGALVELRSTQPTISPAPASSVDQASPQHKPEPEQAVSQLAVRETAEQQPEKVADVPEDDLPEEDGSGFSIAPIGADMLKEEEREIVDAVEVDISELAIEPMSGDILQDDEKIEIDPVEVDISHLSVEDLPPQ